ncbi:mRNA interferase HigB [Variovorax sp. YR752]|uniref:type II toxin-antitoxin system HigB family toxin n=1 Tax=Variovorax sp. YR752 TaxID=1884383 RepID=UPI000BD4F7DA|nr:type II toxin-antitoxin system HigB family toxin [Variovorax sp. YR752]SOD24039.1 mRNA interferase HigB [Variovorax sp. YR752]
MHVVGTPRLAEFSEKHPLTRSWVRSWLAETRRANWTTPHDIKHKYPSASFLSNNLVIFNVKGKDYRLVTQVIYTARVVVVKWIGTHAAYSKVNWEQVQNETRSS